MRGIVHRALSEYVEEHGSDGAWEAVAERADLQTSVYLSAGEYPDEEVPAALSVAADLAGHRPSLVARDFGRYLAPEVLDAFDPMLDDDADAVAVLDRFDELYPRLLSDAEDAADAGLDVRRPDGDTVVVEYDHMSDLYELLVGLVEGVVERRDPEATVREGHDGPGTVGVTRPRDRR